MLTQKIQDAINDQINAELFSSYLYLSMSSWFDSQSLEGMAHWMRIQAQEELAHSLKFFDHLLERGGRAMLAAVEGPRKEWGSPLEVFEETLAHEQKVTGLINDIVDRAINEKDHATAAFLQWFVTEQVEEEATASTILDRLRMIGDNGVALLMIDKELAVRMLPATTEQ